MVEHLTAESFKSKVFDFDANKEWKFEGSKPCIVDVDADWCGPFKTVAPILEDLAKEYEGKIDIDKINTDQEQFLSSIFGIQSIPSLLFIPLGNQPQMATGALPKETFKKVIAEVLMVL